MGSCLGHCHLSKESFSLYKLYSKARNTVGIQINELRRTESVEHIVCDSSLEEKGEPCHVSKYEPVTNKSNFQRIKSIFSNIRNDDCNSSLNLPVLDDEWSLAEEDFYKKAENLMNSSRMKKDKSCNSTSVNSLDLEWEHLPEMAVFSHNEDKEEPPSATSNGGWSRLSSADSLEWDPGEEELKDVDIETEQLLQEIEMLSSKTLQETQEWAS